MMHEGYQMKFRDYPFTLLITSYVGEGNLGHYSLIHNLAFFYLCMMHPYSCIPNLVKPPNSRSLDAYHHIMMTWPPSKTLIPPLILPHDLIHLGISPPSGYASSP